MAIKLSSLAGPATIFHPLRREGVPLGEGVGFTLHSPSSAAGRAALVAQARKIALAEKRFKGTIPLDELFRIGSEYAADMVAGVVGIDTEGVPLAEVLNDPQNQWVRDDLVAALNDETAFLPKSPAKPGKP